MNYRLKYKFGTDVSYLFKDEILPLVKNKKVLELGCGTGEYLQFFGSHSLGLDISHSNLKEASEKGLRVKRFDLNKPGKLAEKYELVFASHILEHVECPICLLRFAHQCLLKEGRIIISVPNENSFIHLKYPYYTQDGNHLYGFTVSNMIEILGYSGFKIKEIYFDYYSAFTRRLKINKLLRVLDFMPMSLRTPFAWAFWFIGEKVKKVE